MLFHKGIFFQIKKKCILYVNEELFIPFTLAEYVSMKVLKDHGIPQLDETWATIPVNWKDYYYSSCDHPYKSPITKLLQSNYFQVLYSVPIYTPVYLYGYWNKNAIKHFSTII